MLNEHEESQLNTGNTEASEQTHANSSVNDGEFSFKREEIPHRSYVDANFQTRSEQSNSTGSSYYTAPVKPEKKKKVTKPVGKTALIAACLVCALLGGVGGGAIVASQLPDGAISQGDSSGSLNVNNNDSSTTKTPNTVASGEVMTGAQIYAMGCKQAVGITTEITYRNYFGMETSSAVSGSGFIVTENGYIVTNYHVIQAAYEGGYDVSVMLYNGETYPAEIIGFEKSNDIAVLKIEASGLSAANLGSSDSLLVGETVYAIGNPLGELSFSLTSGSVSALNRKITTTDSTTQLTSTNNMFQIDAAVNEGNSGGPVYNDRGEVVGIVTAKYSDTGVEGLGFAIPIDDVLDMIDQLVKNGYISGKPSFGITGNTVDSTSAKYYNMVEGVYVLTVNTGSCSETAGIKAGDIITAINDIAIKTYDELVNAKRSFKAGEAVTITVYRGSEYLELQLTFDEESPLSTSNTPSSPSESSGESAYPEDSLPTVPKG